MAQNAYPTITTAGTTVPAAAFAPTGLTGATAASRYVGATTSGAPVSGAFVVGDYVIAQDGTIWVCTGAGSPGTWGQVAPGTHSHVTGDLPSTLATDAEVAAAVTAHEAAGDPHAGYLLESVISALATPAIVLGTAAAAGTGTTPIRHDATIVAFDATVPTTAAFGASAATGSIAFAARRDHTHGMPADPVTAHVAAGDPHTGYLQESVISGLATPAIVLGTAAAAGSTLTPIRSDATIAAFDATVPSTIAFGASAATGSVAFAARRDHTHGAPADPVTAHVAAGDPHTGYLQESVISALATPAILLGTAAAAGTGTTPIRHNATIAAFDVTAPTTIAFGASASTGSIDFAARRDHTHGMPANPVTAHEAAGDPHTGYVLESLIDAAADLFVGTGDNTVGRLAKGAALDVLRVNAGATALEWAAPGAVHTHDGTGGATSLIIGGTAEAGASIPVASSVGAIAIGDYAAATTGTQPIAIGVGQNATAAPSATAQGAIAIGASNGAAINGARASGVLSVAIGSGDAATEGASATASYGVAVGHAAWASGIDGVAVGVFARGGEDATALGQSAIATHARSVALGSGATTTATDQIMMGGGVHQVHIPGTLRIPTGGGASKVLTSDANGVASWAAGVGEFDPVGWMGGM